MYIMYINNKPILPKKVSASQKKDFLRLFKNGKDIKEIANIHKFSAITITSKLKSLLDKEEFKEIKLNNLRKSTKDSKKSNKNKSKFNRKNSPEYNFPLINQDIKKSSEGVIDENDAFFEIAPINDEFDFEKRREFTTEPLVNIKFPETLYMLVDKNIELTPKMLKDYPQWSFMPEDDLKRMTLEIFDDQKYAKKICSKNQKLIKVPNPNVFSLVAKFLKNKGISRIIFNDLLLSI